MSKLRYQPGGSIPAPKKAKLDALFVWDQESKKLLKRSTHKEAGCWQNAETKSRITICVDGVVFFRETLLEIMGIPHDPFVPLRSGPKPGKKRGPRGPRSEYRRQSKKATSEQVARRVSSIFDLAGRL